MEPDAAPREPDAAPTHLDQILDEVLVGGRERRTVVIVDYDPAWPRRFELERERIHRALGTQALRIEHVGSTSVPGLAAKPIVDLIVTVEDPADESIVPAMEAAGYQLRVREPGTACSVRPSAMSTSMYGATPIRRSRAICASATGFASPPRIGTPTSSSSASWRPASGLT